MTVKLLQPSIVKKLFIYLMILSVLPLLAIGGTSYYLSSAAITMQANRFTQAAVNHQRDLLDFRLGQIENLMSDIQGDEEISNALHETGDSSSTYTRLATKTRIGYILNGYLSLEGLVSIGVYAVGGAHYQVGDTLDVDEVREDIRDRLLKETLAGGNFIHWAGVEKNINAQSLHPMVLSAASVFSEVNDKTLEQQPVALLVANYSLETFASSLRSLDDSDGTYFVVIDGHDRFIYHPDMTLVGTAPSTDILRLIKSDSISPNGDDADVALNGQRMVVKTAVFKRNGWRIASFTPLKALTKPIEVIRASTLGIFGLCLLVILLVAYRYSRQVVAPIRRVTDDFKAFERGQLSSQRRLVTHGQDEISELVRWHNTFLEVVAQQQAAKMALEESESRFRDFAESSSDWFWEYDAEHRLTTLSDRFFETINVDRADVINHSRIEIAQRLGGEMDDYSWQQHLRDLREHRPFRIVYPLRGRDGKLSFVRSSGKPIFDIDGNFVGYRGTGTDVSKEVRAEQAMIEMNRTLEAHVQQRTEALMIEKEKAQLANRSKTEFLNNMSHELRTPLNAILGFADVMSSGIFGPIENSRYAGYVRDIHASGTYLLEIIGDILDLSRIEIGKLQVDEEIIDVAATIASTQRMIIHKAKAARVELEIDIAPDLPRMKADSRRLKQIVLNLLSNAVKFTRAGGHVRLRTWCNDENEIQIEVADTGIGIADEHKQIVFEPFGKVESSYARAHEGIGLGLPIVKSLVQMHGGTLAMWSQLGEGTAITITFPASRTVQMIVAPAT